MPLKTTPLSYIPCAGSLTRNCERKGRSFPSLRMANGSPMLSYFAKHGSGSGSLLPVTPVAGSTCLSCCGSAVGTRSFFRPAAPTSALALFK